MHVVGWSECSWDFGDCDPPSSSTKEWSRLTDYEKKQVEGKQCYFMMLDSDFFDFDLKI